MSSFQILVAVLTVGYLAFCLYIGKKLKLKSKMQTIIF